MRRAGRSFSTTRRAAAAATTASGVVTAPRLFMRSRSTLTAVVPGYRRPSVTAPHLIQFGVAVRTPRPGQLLGAHLPQRAGPRRHARPLLPANLDGRLVEFVICPLMASLFPDSLI